MRALVRAARLLAGGEVAGRPRAASARRRTGSRGRSSRCGRRASSARGRAAPPHSRRPARGSRTRTASVSLDLTLAPFQRYKAPYQSLPDPGAAMERSVVHRQSRRGPGRPRRPLARAHARTRRRPAAAARPRARGRGLLRARWLNSRSGSATTPPSSSSPAGTSSRPTESRTPTASATEPARVPRHLRPGRLRPVPARGRPSRLAAPNSRPSMARPTSNASPASPPTHGITLLGPPGTLPADLVAAT